MEHQYLDRTDILIKKIYKTFAYLKRMERKIRNSFRNNKNKFSLYKYIVEILKSKIYLF